MNIWKILDQIENAVSSSQRLPAPFSHWTLVNRHNFNRLMEKMRTGVPTELRYARAVNKDVQRLISEAQEQADQILLQAREQAKQASEGSRTERELLVNGTEIVQKARKKAQEIEEAARAAAEDLEAQTRARCLELRRQAEEYARDLRLRAEKDVTLHEEEIGRYAIRLLSGMEVEIGRALQLVRAHREDVETRQKESTTSEAADEVTVTIEPEETRRLISVAAAARGRSHR